MYFLFFDSLCAILVFGRTLQKTMLPGPHSTCYYYHPLQDADPRRTFVSFNDDNRAAIMIDSNDADRLLGTTPDVLAAQRARRMWLAMCSLLAIPSACAWAFSFICMVLANEAFVADACPRSQTATLTIFIITFTCLSVVAWGARCRHAAYYSPPVPPSYDHTYSLSFPAAGPMGYS